jgi:tol-pal system protein YbgF
MRTCKLRNRFLAAAALLMVLTSTSIPAHAVSKDMIQLQTQVQQLLDMVQRLQSTMDSKFGVIQNLAQQTADQASQMQKAVDALQQKLDAQTQAQSGKVDAVSGQVQSLNDSVDELKTRIAKLDKSIQDLQAQLQQLQSQPNPGAVPGAAPGGAAPSPQGAAPNPSTGASSAPAGDQNAPAPGASMNAAPSPPMAQRPPLEETYQAALKDFNAGRYQLAASEFNDVIHNYPLDDLAGTSQFYLGEIAYQQQNYNDAVNNYNVVIESFSGNAKAPTAQLHKGLALLAMGKKEAGVRELRVLIQRHPQTPEAASARRKLSSMHATASR